MGAKATVTQSSFLGGEWAPVNDTRQDNPAYRTACAALQNMILVEQGAATRRSGTEWLGPSYKRMAAQLLAFQSSALTPLCAEFTPGSLNAGADGALKFWYGTGPVCNSRNVITASSSSGGTLTLTGTGHTGWAIGDQFIIFCPSGITMANAGVVANRTLSITGINTGGANDIITAVDDMGVALPMNITSGGLNTATMLRLLRFTYTGLGSSIGLETIRLVQAQTAGFTLAPGLAPQAIVMTTDVVAGSDADPAMGFSAASFVDGPYLDPTSTFGTACGTVSAYSGSITYTPSDGTTFDSVKDIGRHIRLWSQPGVWASGSTYNYGNTVTYPAGTEQFWVSIDKNNANTNQIPGTVSLQTTNVSIAYWAPSPTEGQWAWGKITAVGGGGTSCTVSLQTSLNSNNGTTITGCQLGVYRVGTYPTCGMFTEGRLWLAGAVTNRFDATMTGGADITTLTFSPTDIYNTVNDDHGISETFNFGDDMSTIQWMAPDPRGIICGTPGGEILLASSTLDDAMTPSNIRARRVSRVKGANVVPVRIGTALLFIQRFARRVIEYLEVLNLGGAPGYTGRHLNENARHITDPGVTEIHYQEETAPVVWATMKDGTFAGCTYRRLSRYATDAPVFEGWHRQIIGDGSVTITSACTVPGVDGTSDQLFLSTNDVNGQGWIETLRPIFETV